MLECSKVAEIHNIYFDVLWLMDERQHRISTYNTYAGDIVNHQTCYVPECESDQAKYCERLAMVVKAD